MDVAFMRAPAAPALQPVRQGVVSASRSYYLRNTFRKAAAAVHSGPSRGSGQSTLRTFWKGLTILEAIKNTRDSWEEVRTSTLTGVWRKLIPAPLEDWGGRRLAWRKSPQTWRTS